MSKKRFGLGILIGAVAGVVTGLLTAPKSGKETREDIKKMAGEARSAAEKKLKQGYKELAELSDQAKVKAKELQGQAQANLNELSKKADELKDKAKAAITSVKSGDDEHDDVTIDKLLADMTAVKDKIAKEVKSLGGDVKSAAKDLKKNS